MSTWSQRRSGRFSLGVVLYDEAVTARTVLSSMETPGLWLRIKQRRAEMFPSCTTAQLKATKLLLQALQEHTTSWQSIRLHI